MKSYVKLKILFLLQTYTTMIYIKRSYFRPTVWLWCYHVTNVQNQKLQTTLDQTEDKQLKKLDL